MKKLFIFLSFFLMLQSVHAQSLTPTVVASGGNYSASGGYSLSYTIGETGAVTTLTTTNNILTQGFQQPEDVHVGVIEVSMQNMDVKLYPNPANDLVNVFIKCNSVSGCNNIKVTIHDLLGRELKITNDTFDKLSTGLLTNGNEKLYTFNIKQLASSMYFVRLHDLTTNTTQIIKFNKSSL